MTGRHVLHEPVELDWAIRANCVGIDSETFFNPTHEAEAKAICAGCEVRAECLAASWALNADGIWGGYNHDERKRQRRTEQRRLRANHRSQ